MTSFLDITFYLSALNGISACVVDQVLVIKSSQSNLNSNSKSSFLFSNTVDIYILNMNRMSTYTFLFNGMTNHFVSSTIKGTRSVLNIPGYEVNCLYTTNPRENGVSIISQREHLNIPSINAMIVNFCISYADVNSNIYHCTASRGNFLSVNIKKGKVVHFIKTGSDPLEETYGLISDMDHKTGNRIENTDTINNHGSRIVNTEEQGIIFKQMGTIINSDNEV